MEEWILEVRRKHERDQTQYNQKQIEFETRHYPSPIDLQTDLWIVWNIFDFKSKLTHIDEGGIMCSFIHESERAYVDISIFKAQNSYEILLTSEHPISGMSEELIGTAHTLEEVLLVTEKHLSKWEILILEASRA